jgi:hypothetical protein
LKEDVTMKTTLPSKRRVGAVLFVLPASLVTVSAQGAGQPPVTRAPESDTIIGPGTAAEAVEDTLKACMGRIPKDAVGYAASRDDVPVHCRPNLRTYGKTKYTQASLYLSWMSPEGRGYV